MWKSEFRRQGLACLLNLYYKIMSKIFTSPLYVEVSRNTMGPKKVLLNLNAYPNLYYQTYNKAKIEYKELMKDQMEGVKLNTPIMLNFKLWRKDSRKGDRANVLAVVEKFFCDALQEWGCIENDSDEYILGQTYSTGGIDRDFPRVEIEIIEADK